MSIPSRVYRSAMLMSALALASCGGAGHSLTPAVQPAANAGAGTLTAQAQAHGQKKPHERLIAILKLSVDGTGAHFSIGGDDDIFRSKHALSEPIPAFTLTCPKHEEDEEDDNRLCRSHWFGDGDGDKDDRRNYYVRAIKLWDFDDSTVVAGPGVSTGKHTVSFDAANAPLTLDADTSYAFVLVAVRGTLATPTPAASPTPTPVVDVCAVAPTASGLRPPKAMPAPVVASGAPSFATTIPLKASGTVGRLACGADGRTYFTVTQLIGGVTNAIAKDGTLSQFASVGAPDIVRGGDGLIYEQGAFGLSKSPQVARFTADGSSQTLFAGGLVGFLTAGPDGNVYTLVNGGGTYTLQQLKADGSLAQFALPSPCAASGAYDAAAAGAGGKLWLHSTACGIVGVTTSGSASVVNPLTASVGALATGPDGALYATNQQAPGIDRIDPASGASLEWTLPSTLRPGGLIAAGGAKVLFDAYDSNSGSEKLNVLDLSTGALTEYDFGSTTFTGSYVRAANGTIYAGINNGAAALLAIDPSALP